MDDTGARWSFVCRSITGDAVRKAIRIRQEHILREIRKVPSGNPIID